MHTDKALFSAETGRKRLTGGWEEVESKGRRKFGSTCGRTATECRTFLME